jgi:putative hydrolase
MSVPAAIDFGQDWHVHSRFSDGAGSLEENVAAAERLGLSLLGCVDHVRADSTYVPSLVAAVQELRRSTRVELCAAVEAKMLDDSGALDLPPDGILQGIDFVVIADHQVPSPDGPRDPAAVRDAITGGNLDQAMVFNWIVDATSRALERRPGALIAHLFSVLPKAGVSDAAIDARGLATLIGSAKSSGAMLEVSERWQTPSRSVAAAFAQAGVPVVASTDAHRPQDIGRYLYGHTAAEAAGGRPTARRMSRGTPTWRAHSTRPA